MLRMLDQFATLRCYNCRRMKNPGRKLIACMKRFNCVVAVLLTYVLCASALLQPVSVYAASAAGEGAGSVATEQSNSSEEADESADQPEGQGGEEQEASVQEDQNESQITDSDDVSGDAETTDQDSSASEESEADDSAASYKANSWRYIDGELRNDIRDDNASEANFYGRAMHRMPDGATAQGIDVSGLQGDIDWQKVKDAGIDYAIIKIGSRDNNGWWTDSRFLRNVSECERLGIPWGAYVYSYARNATEATEEADFAISKLSGHHPTLPIYFDLEETPKEGESIKWLPYTDSAAMASIAKAFCNRISSAGYKPGIYASAGWFKYYLTDPCFSNSGWSIWTAQYWYDPYNASLGLAPEYPAKFDCWQYSYRGSIPGISSNVDVNYCYGDYLKSDSLDTDNVTAGPHVSVTAHVSSVGWLGTVSDGATAGTTGRSLSLEAVKVSLSNAEASGSIEVNAHVSNIGWQGWDEPSASEGGTTGQSKSIEALQFRLTGEMAGLYDVWYRVHASNIGWMGWAKDGEDAGTTGLSTPLEAVQVVLVRKGEAAPGSTDTPYLTTPDISYGSLMSGGWQNDVAIGETSGIAGQDSIHALELHVGSDVDGSLKYRVHLSDVGWRDYVTGGIAGSMDAKHSIQAVEIAPMGKLSKNFDIYYRVYVEKIGWLGWAKNGAPAGTTSCALNIQAIQVCVRLRGAKAPGYGTAYCSSTADLPYSGYQNPSQYYQVSNHSVSIKNMGSGIFGYRTESRIPWNATRLDCVNAMITRAYDYVGTTPYIWDYSCAPGVGVDCAGLVMQCLYATGMDLGRYNPWDHYYTPGHDHYANDMWNDPRFKHLDFSQRQRGDLICYNGHIAVYIGNDQIIEAASPRVGVRVHSVYVGYAIKGVLRPFV